MGGSRHCGVLFWTDSRTLKNRTTQTGSHRKYTTWHTHRPYTSSVCDMNSTSAVAVCYFRHYTSALCLCLSLKHFLEENRVNQHQKLNKGSCTYCPTQFKNLSFMNSRPLSTLSIYCSIKVLSFLPYFSSCHQLIIRLHRALDWL